MIKSVDIGSNIDSKGDIDKEVGIPTSMYTHQYIDVVQIMQIVTRSRFPNYFGMFVILMLIAIIPYISGTPLLKQLENRAKKKSVPKSGADYKSRTFQQPQMKMSRRKPSAKDMLVLDNQNVKLLITER